MRCVCGDDVARRLQRSRPPSQRRRRDWRCSSTGWPRPRSPGSGRLRTASTWLRCLDPTGTRLHPGLRPLQHRPAYFRQRRSLADLLDAIVGGCPPGERWYSSVTRWRLVIRSACHLGATDRRAWTPLVSEVVYLGHPTSGALGARSGARRWAFNRLPETRPFTPLVNGRAPGSKDSVRVRSRGGVVRLRSQRVPTQPPPPRPAHGHRQPRVISVTVTADPHSPVGPSSETCWSSRRARTVGTVAGATSPSPSRPAAASAPQPF